MPIPLYRSAEILELERAALTADPGARLMERAGLAAAEAARQMLGDGFRVLITCGPGNNGGDGLVAARHLRDWGYRVTCVLLGEASKLPADASAALEAFRESGGVLDYELPPLQRFDLIVDGLLGIGLARKVEGRLAEAITTINACGLPVLALDVPSGLNGSTGVAMGETIVATRTITFLAHKPGLHTADGRDHAGEVTLATLDVDASSVLPSRGALLDESVLAQLLKPRKHNSHKGSYGSVAVLGGASGMQGALVLATRAALLLGAGRVYAAALGGNALGFDPLQPEVMWRSPGECLAMAHLTALVVGPGMGTGNGAREALMAALDIPLPVVLDADALNLLAMDETLRPQVAERTHPTIITPHPSEAARLLGITTKDVQNDRISAALELAEQLGVVTALKGSGTVCASPNGEWRINPTGNAALATAGSGDILAGMLGALLARGLPPELSLHAATFLHGACADFCLPPGHRHTVICASDLPRIANEYLAHRAQMLRGVR